MRSLRAAPCISLLSFFSLLFGQTQGNARTEDDLVSFQLATDRATYHVGDAAVLSFTIANVGGRSIYVSRDLGLCGKWTGAFDLTVLDHLNNRVSRVGCDVFVTRIPDESLKDSFRSSYWKVLLPGETYSLQEGIDVPAHKGKYHLVAELMPPSFSDHQVELLTADGIRVLRLRHRAPLVDIVVK
jgi:hypothetical protein